MKFLKTFSSCWKFPIKGKLSKKSKSKPKNGFPLLNLPRVVLLECIENLDVLEIIIFSLLSKRAKSIATLIRWDIYLNLTTNKEISLTIPWDPYQEWIIEHDDMKEPSEYPYFKSKWNGTISLHYLVLRSSENPFEDFKQMFEHIYEVLRSPIYDIHIMEKPQLEWLIEFQPIIRKIWIRGDVNTPFETLDRIFKSLKVTDCFRLQSVEADMKTKVTEPLPYRSITIDHSYWLSLPAILNGNNFIILLDRSELTPKEINTILKEWQMGNKLRNLKYLKIGTSKLKDLDSFTNEVLKDLNSTESDGNDGRPSAAKIDGTYEFYWLPRADVVHNLIRSDGMIGSIFPSFILQRDRTITELCVHFQVWSRQT